MKSLQARRGFTAARLQTRCDFTATPCRSGASRDRANTTAPQVPS
ncbi:hypothetical protein AZ78_2883 [Lysobacter capsici AZ78]|uniref:Uncharacterized protein n=1 Tax=Lysobacter capsici AZ78 TaxID=1444315 RepID=A0A120AGY9_9GAMM|nr:hypothetical protein AZ78_2883 [Lysobacter capsici AZ78]